ncbi:hypothetical protein [Xanthomonas oryzae]|uniref:hypothetical protein n=1 Tax=Xanthomonas oryzae TaxID=347 RepID=UPI0011BEDAF4|nr:hypothetical protein [Xanthomonas oryzae]MDI9071021.1 hypothetical protein [Xanthomonas oryzae pv. oryzae]MDI9079371.1 hypothetical protein [Xanthomonas oryzae pv. oryzae]MDI9102123.1 hypothetical protein [Xanthomonas oryzae pv. oryzae]MDI9910849.1 hypothetical protein [Xanthomonas oryzae pv. oryzae]UUF79280.1 hypothetical protein NO935_01405 [Xanthomonas oryzae pv. oryzae]
MFAAVRRFGRRAGLRGGCRVGRCRLVALAGGQHQSSGQKQGAAEEFAWSTPEEGPQLQPLTP